MGELISVRIITADGINGIAEFKSDGRQGWLHFPDGDITEKQNQPRIAAVINDALEWDESRNAFRITGTKDVELVVELDPLAKPLNKNDEAFLLEYKDIGLPPAVLAAFPMALSLAILTAQGEVIEPDEFHAPIKLFKRVKVRDCIEISK